MSDRSQQRPRLRVLVTLATMVAATLVVIAPHAGAGGHSDQLGLVDTGQGLWTMGGAQPFFFGNPGDVPMVGDWDCNGTATPGLYRQSDGFVYLRNSNTEGVADIRFFFGNPGDVPLAGDFDDDGCDTVSVYRPATGQVFIINELGEDEGGLGAADMDYFFGNPGDRPFVGDFDGDGVDTVGLHRISTGFVYFRNSHSAGVADSEFFWGDPNDVVLAGDWDGTGDDTVGLLRPSASRFYWRNSNEAGPADDSVPVPSTAAFPVAGAFGTAFPTTIALDLSGSAQVPGPGDVDGSGTAKLVLSEGQVCFDLTVADIDTVTAAHIHQGTSTDFGGVVVDFNYAVNGLDGCVAAAPVLITFILDNPAGYYVNVHTADFPAGAIRGQLG